MRTVFKYQLDQPITHLDLSKRAVPRHVHEQNGCIVLWVEVDSAALSNDRRKFQWFGTGHPIPERAIYIGTAHIEGFVWHVYEILEKGLSNE